MRNCCINETYDRVIAIKERSAGNESVGDMWLETKSFDKTATIEEVLLWAIGTGGKLIITIDESTLKSKSSSETFV